MILDDTGPILVEYDLEMVLFSGLNRITRVEFEDRGTVRRETRYCVEDRLVRSIVDHQIVPISKCHRSTEGSGGQSLIAIGCWTGVQTEHL